MRVVHKSEEGTIYIFLTSFSIILLFVRVQCQFRLDPVFGSGAITRLDYCACEIIRRLRQLLKLHRKM